MFNFNGSNVLILGGSGHIGKRITKFFLDQKSNVLNCDINNSFKSNLKDSYHFNKFKININKDYSNQFKKIVSQFGCPDIFINCSYPRYKNYKNCSPEKINLPDINNNLVLHLGSYTFIANIIAKEMSKRKTRGKIILFSSIYGIVAQNTDLYKGTNLNENLIYPVIKSGIISLTRQLASVYAKNNLNINCLSPGGVAGHTAYDKTSISRKFQKKYSSKLPLNRMAEPEDLISSIAYLSSSYSNYITGHNLVVDGGYTII